MLTAAAMLLAIGCELSAQESLSVKAPASADTCVPIVDESGEHEGPRRMSSDADVMAALEMPVTLDFDETPLADVADYLADVANINVDIDHKALEEIGVGADTPVTIAVGRVRIKSALNHILLQLDLAHTVRNGALLISTPEALEDALIERAHPVADLAQDDPLAAGGGEFDALIEAVQWLIRPASWEDVGGPASIAPGEGSIVVKQSWEGHSQIEQYVGALRAAREIAARHAQSAPPIPSVWVAHGEEKEIRAALAKNLTLSMVEAPLAAVAALLAEATGVNILIDVRALEDVGIADDTPITFKVDGVSAAACLSLILQPLDLTWEIRDEALVITTPEEAELRLQLRVYPVLDLLQPADADGLALDEEFLDYDELIDLIVGFVRPTTWEEVGGPATITPAGSGCLAISQTIDAFDEIDAFLTAHRQALAQYHEDPERVFTAAIAADAPRHDDLRRKLKQQQDALTFSDTPLMHVVDALSKRHDIPMLIDDWGLEDVGLGRDLPVTARLERQPLGEALRRLLKGHGLSWALSDEVVWITNKEEADVTFVVKFYPVRDLVEREQDLDINAAVARGEALHGAITSRLHPDGWEEQGGPGAIKALRRPLLVVMQREEVHDAAAALLAEFREDPSWLQKQLGIDGARRWTNAKGETLYEKNYALRKTSVEETERLVEMARSLVETSPWKSDDGYSIRPSMTGATILMKHTAPTHRAIQRLLIALDVYPSEVEDQGLHGGLHGGLGGGRIGGGGLGGWRPAFSNIASLSLSAANRDNSLDKTLVLRVVRLDPEHSATPERLAEEIRKQVDSESWRTHSAVSLYPFRQQLIIRHTPTAQRKIHRLLSNKDALRKPLPSFGSFF